MTFTDYLQKHLTDNGLCPKEADAVIAQWLETPGSEPMQYRMHDDMEGYPAALKAATVSGIRYEAVTWIDANEPKHFARALLVD